MIPFVEEIRKEYELKDSDAAYIILDGEQVQLDPCFDDDIIALFRTHNIRLGKPPASSTGINQPCDAGKCFLDAKTKTKSIAKADRCV